VEVIEVQAAVCHEVVEPLDELGLREDRQLVQRRTGEARVLGSIPGRPLRGVFTESLKSLRSPSLAGGL
jgi:hypothetical protein